MHASHVHVECTHCVTLIARECAHTRLLVRLVLCLHYPHVPTRGTMEDEQNVHLNVVRVTGTTKTKVLWGGQGKSAWILHVVVSSRGAQVNNHLAIGIVPRRQGQMPYHSRLKTNHLSQKRRGSQSLTS